MTMMMICGHSEQVPQRNAIPTTVNLWQSVQSHTKLRQNCDPVLGAHGPSPAFVERLRNTCSTATFPLPTVLAVRLGVLYSSPCFSTHRHVYAQGGTTRLLAFSAGRDPLLGALGPSLSSCPLLTKPPYLLPHCHNPITYCTIHAVRLGV